jgi:hypothetical protein
MLLFAICVLLILMMLGSVAWFRRSRNAALWLAASLWILYVPYEYLMYRRILCSGECNIRVDLLVIYPVLLLVTLAALGRLLWFWRRDRDG